MEQSLYVGNVTGYAIADGFLKLVRIEEGSEEFRAHYGAMDEGGHLGIGKSVVRPSVRCPSV